MVTRLALLASLAVETLMVAAFAIDSWQTLAAFTAAVIGLVSIGRYAVRAIRKLATVHDDVHDTACRSRRIEEALWLLLDDRRQAAKDALAGRTTKGPTR